MTLPLTSSLEWAKSRGPKGLFHLLHCGFPDELPTSHHVYPEKDHRVQCVGYINLSDRAWNKFKGEQKADRSGSSLDQVSHRYLLFCQSIFIRVFWDFPRYESPCIPIQLLICRILVECFRSTTRPRPRLWTGNGWIDLEIGYRHASYFGTRTNLPADISPTSSVDVCRVCLLNHQRHSL